MTIKDISHFCGVSASVASRVLNDHLDVLRTLGKAVYDFFCLCGNPYFTDLDLLIEGEATARQWGTEPRCVDYRKSYESHFVLLQTAKNRGWKRDREKVAVFVAENERWLPDYALLMACKRHVGMSTGRMKSSACATRRRLENTTASACSSRKKHPKRHNDKSAGSTTELPAAVLLSKKRRNQGTTLLIAVIDS